MKRRGGVNWLSLFGGLVILVVVGSVIGGLIVTGGPDRARKEIADENRAQDLLAILKGVRSFYKQKGALPTTITEAIEKAGMPASELKDPVTGLPYEYHRIDKAKFELCATFQAEPTSFYRGYDDSPEGAESRLFRHKKGHQCFEFPAVSK